MCWQSLKGIHKNFSLQSADIIFLDKLSFPILASHLPEKGPDALSCTKPAPPSQSSTFCITFHSLQNQTQVYDRLGQLLAHTSHAQFWAQRALCIVVQKSALTEKTGVETNDMGLQWKSREKSMRCEAGEGVWAM